MTTYQTTFLSKPTGDTEIPRDVLTYISARNRQQSYNLVIRALKESGISQATLARRLGKGPEVVSRLLSRPRNWEQNTLSELIFAISGGGISYAIELPRTHSPSGSQPPAVDARAKDRRPKARASAETAGKRPAGLIALAQEEPREFNPARAGVSLFDEISRDQQGRPQ